MKAFPSSRVRANVASSQSTETTSPVQVVLLARAGESSLIIQRLQQQNSTNWQAILAHWDRYLPFNATSDAISIRTYHDYHGDLTQQAWQLDTEAFAKLLREYRLSQQGLLILQSLASVTDYRSILQSLSDLASAMVDVAYRFVYTQLCEKYGTPMSKSGQRQELSIFGMGKLGGEELNFSSDIDLIMAYPEHGETTGIPCPDDPQRRNNQIDNALFFHRLAQRLIRLLDHYDENGFVYRVDMRLKPFGSVGTLCPSFASMERYYLEHGRHWERYALIKMRTIAGNINAGESLINRLAAFVYQRHADFAAVASIDDMKDKIIEKGREKGLKNNLKLGHGGIREIEFIVQALQLLYGGRIELLRTASLLEALQILGEKKLITQKVMHMLSDNYLFLRRVENAVQFYQDQQTHDLPQQPSAQQALLSALGFTDWAILDEQVARIRFEVAQLFSRTFASNTESSNSEDSQRQESAYWLEQLNGAGILSQTEEKSARQEMAQNFATFYRRMSEHDLGEKYLIRLNWVLPQVIAALVGEPHPAPLAKHMLVLLEAIADKSVYLSLLVENSEVLKKIIRLFMASEWMTRFLCEHPLVLDELVHESHETARIDQSSIVQSLVHTLEQTTDNAEKIKKVLDFKNAQVFRIASADLQNKIKLVHVSDQLTWVAEVIIAELLQLAHHELVAKYGEPSYQLDGKTHKASLGVIAYGKLGGLEMGYGSDLDLVFLHDSQGEHQQTDGEKTLANEVFFTRLVQQVITYLTSITENGKLYEVDTRLRPDGNSGLSVASLHAFEKYQLQQAWTWEHQALVRGRFICGSDNIAHQFRRIRLAITSLAREAQPLAQEVSEMRQKMRQIRQTSKATVPNLFDIKHDIGGITDIEFIVQYLLLLHSQDIPELVRCSDNLRQISALELFEILPTSEASELREAYRSYRLCLHHQQLKNLPNQVSSEHFVEERQMIKHIWNQYLQPSH